MVWTFWQALAADEEHDGGGVEDERAGLTPISSAVKRDAVVADVIPNPPRTLFLREAEARGLRTLDGLGMLVNQGVVSIRHWFGVDVEASAMRRTLEELFGV